MQKVNINSPLINVIIPVYNGDKYIAESIQSVLNQSYSSSRIIVVDDGSTDRTAEVIKQFPVDYLYQLNGGSGSARNLGVLFAQSDFLAFLDADDLWSKDKLAIQMATLNQREDLDLVFGHLKYFISPDLSEQHHPLDQNVIEGLQAGSMLIRRSAFEKVGLFSTAVRLGEFIDWYSRAMELGLKALTLPDIVMYRRIHQNNTTKLRKHERQEYTRILHQVIRRRRELKSKDNDLIGEISKGVL